VWWCMPHVEVHALHGKIKGVCSVEVMTVVEDSPTA
jgi:hypothetical protein